MDINESPVYVLLNPSINHAQKDLPVTIYESGNMSRFFSSSLHGFRRSTSISKLFVLSINFFGYMIICLHHSHATSQVYHP